MRTLVTLALTLSTAALAQETPEPPPASEESPADGGMSQTERDRLLDELLQERAERQAAEAAERAAAEAALAKEQADRTDADRYAAWNRAEKVIRYEEGMPVTDLYTRKRIIRKGPVAAGASMLGVAYFAATLTAAIDDDVDGYGTLNALYAPVVGPWIAMGLDGSRGDLTHAGGWALGIDGVVQAVGTGLLIWGLVDKKEVLVKKPFALTGVSAAPSAGGGHLSMSGRF